MGEFDYWFLESKGRASENCSPCSVLNKRAKKKKKKTKPDLPQEYKTTISNIINLIIWLQAI